MQDKQPTAEQPAAHPAAQDAGAEAVAAGKPAKSRKPRAPRKRKPKEAAAGADAAAEPVADGLPPQANQADAALPPVTAPVIEQAREEAQTPAEPVAATPAEGNSQTLTAHDGGELRGAKPRKSGRRAWEINLRGDGQTWERVSTPENEVAFRFKDRPGDGQMALIEKYGFAWDPERKEAHRADDAEGRAAADKLSWYLKEAGRSRGAARTA